MTVKELANRLRQLMLEHPHTTNAELEMVIRGTRLEDGTHEDVHAVLRRVKYSSEVVKHFGPVELRDK